MRAAPVFNPRSFGWSCDAPSGKSAITPPRERSSEECFPIASDVGAGVLAAVHGDRAEGAGEEADDRHAKERGLREEGDGPRSEAEKEEGIDEAVGMVENEDDRARCRNSFRARDLDAPKEDAEKQAKTGGAETANHV